MRHDYRDRFVASLFEDIGKLIEGDASQQESIRQRLSELAINNCTITGNYWKYTQVGRGIPDLAFKIHTLYFFPEEPPARCFVSSGTLGGGRSTAYYSRLGLELMRFSILR